MRLGLKTYQRDSLDRLEEYAGAVRASFLRGAPRSERDAFEEVTGREYYSAPRFQGVPYICLRLPTGGGKTLLAAHAIGRIATALLQTDRATCLWITPSTTIRDQTLRALRQPHHPYRDALEDSLGTSVQIATLEEALTSSRLVTGTTPLVLVTTIQSYRIRDETSGEELAATRRIYRDNGYLQEAFENLPAWAREELAADENGVVSLSLANALRLRRPIVIMDEAHNARTLTSFDSLQRFGPSFVLELTATPEHEHDVANGKFASNVLYAVSALALKTEGMIKLPVDLESRSDWLEVLAATKQRREELEVIADRANVETGLPFIRPIALIQAQQRSQTRETHTVENVKAALIEPLDVPEEWVKICTGTLDELGDIDLNATNCEVRYVVTVDKLREGWDCPFAYVLGSIGHTATPTAVEQLLGRIMRMPFANPTRVPALDRCYAFVLSNNVVETALELRDRLVETCGFDNESAEEALRVRSAGTQTGFEFGRIPVSAPPRSDVLPLALANRVQFDAATSSLVLTDLPTPGEVRLLREAMTDERDRQAVDQYWERERPGGFTIRPLTEVARPLVVPQLAVRINNRLSLLEPIELDQFHWNMDECDPSIPEEQFSSDIRVGSAALIDIDNAQGGRGEGLVARAAGDVRLRQLELIGEGEDWTETELVRWIDDELHRDDSFLGLPLAESQPWVRRVVNGLTTGRGFDLPMLARRRHELAQVVRTMVADHGRQEARRATEQLFRQEPDAVEVSDQLAMMVEEQSYRPSRLVESGFRFQRHAFHEIGHMNDEEHECAMRIDGHSNVARWLRNVDRISQGGFSLPLSPGRYFPDFIAELRDGRTALIEYKNSRLGSHVAEQHKKAVGELWAGRSNGRAVFSWVVDRDWVRLENDLS